MDKEQAKSYKRELYNTAFAVLKLHMDNSEAHTLSTSISDKCTTVCQQAWNDGERHIKNAMSCKNGGEPVRVLSKEDLEQDIMRDIESGGLSKDQKLKYITELNKLQDNYSNDPDTEWIVELVQYLCPVCDKKQPKFY